MTAPTETLSEERLGEIERDAAFALDCNQVLDGIDPRDVAAMVSLAREALASRRTPVSGEVTEARSEEHAPGLRDAMELVRQTHAEASKPRKQPAKPGDADFDHGWKAACETISAILMARLHNPSLTAALRSAPEQAVEPVQTVRAHKWVPSRLGHGEQMCEYCKGTNRELAVLGELDSCSAAPPLASPVAAEQTQPGLELAARWHDAQAVKAKLASVEAAAVPDDAKRLMHELTAQAHENYAAAIRSLAAKGE